MCLWRYEDESIYTNQCQYACPRMDFWPGYKMRGCNTVFGIKTKWFSSVLVGPLIFYILHCVFYSRVCSLPVKCVRLIKRQDLQKKGQLLRGNALYHTYVLLSVVYGCQ